LPDITTASDYAKLIGKHIKLMEELVKIMPDAIDTTWGGLKRVLTPEDHYLWLCEHHAQEYRR